MVRFLLFLFLFVQASLVELLLVVQTNLRALFLAAFLLELFLFETA